MLDIIYQDESIVVCVKPFRVLSTDEPGGMRDRIRVAIGQKSRMANWASGRPRSAASCGWTWWWAA